MIGKDMIAQKKKGFEHTEESIEEFITGYMSGDVSETQMSAWLTAVCFNGLTNEETLSLVKAMIKYDAPHTTGLHLSTIDKHSTGGVGDKTTLVVIPLLATLGIPIVKLSGKSLGFTGGTIDKLKSIPNIQLDKSIEEIKKQLEVVPCYIGEQSEQLSSVDKKLYSLRDHIDAVDNPYLIAASIMSKKIASGAKHFVFDVKVGNGAFFKTEEDAQIAIETMKYIANAFERNIVFVLSRMNEPLGDAIGNQLEVLEAIEVLKGEQLTTRFVKLCVVLAAHMIVLSEHAINDYAEAYALAYKTLQSGEAYKTFEKMIAEQNGDLNEAIFAEAEYTYDFYARKNGYITEIKTDEVGIASQILGAGLYGNHKTIQPTSGIQMKKHIGDEVFVGEAIARLHYDTDRLDVLQEALIKLDDAFIIEDIQAAPKKEDIVLDEIH